MKLIFRWAFRLFILLIVLLVAGLLLLDTIARDITEYNIRSRTGLDVKIGKMHVGLFNPRLTVEHVVLYNSAEFGGSPLFDLPELHVEYERSTLFSSRPHCRLVRLNLARLNVVEDKNGNINLDVLEKRWQTPHNQSRSEKNKPAAVQFPRIDTLNLTLGQATFMSMKQPGHVEPLAMDIHNQVLTNVGDARDLGGVATVILLKNGISINDNGGANGQTNYWRHWLGRFIAPSKK